MFSKERVVVKNGQVVVCKEGLSRRVIREELDKVLAEHETSCSSCRFYRDKCNDRSIESPSIKRAINVFGYTHVFECSEYEKRDIERENMVKDDFLRLLYGKEKPYVGSYSVCNDEAKQLLMENEDFYDDLYSDSNSVFEYEEDVKQLVKKR